MIPATLLLAEQRECARGHFASVLRFGRGPIRPRRSVMPALCNDCHVSQRHGRYLRARSRDESVAGVTA